MKNNIIGRKSEQDTLTRIYESRQSEFVAVCGRRRVGKTFLVREYFEQEMVFQASGLAGGNTQEQLKNFFYTLRRYDRKVSSVPHDWLDAFEMLISYLDSLSQVERKVVFLDELPWMDTMGSDFISALEHFWNGWASARRDNTINLCEMKFSEGEFAINKDYDKILRNKIARFMEETKTRKSIQLT